MTCIVRKEIRLNEKSTPELASEVDCGADGTRTRDPMRDRHVF